MGQHRVAEFYLRRFGQRPGPRTLFEYVKGFGFREELSPKRASAENKSAFTIDGPDENAAENFFGSVERDAKPVFTRIQSQLPLTEQDRAHLAQFASLSYVRSTRIAEHFAKVRTLFTLDGMEAWLRTPGAMIDCLLRNPHMNAEGYHRDVGIFMQSVRAGMEPPPSSPPRNHQLSLLDFNAQWVDTLMRMNWCIEVAPNDSFFVVGDEPLCARRPDRILDVNYVPIAGEPTVEVTFPLNRRMCLVARWTNELAPLTYVKVAAERVHNLNLRTVMCAHRKFWSPFRRAECNEYIRIIGEQGIQVSIPVPDTLPEFFEKMEQMRRHH